MTPERFDTSWILERVSVEETAGACWLWGLSSVKGTPRVKLNGNGSNLRRVLWQLSYGDIAAEMTIGTSCSEALCVKPSHLELRPMRRGRRSS